MTRRVNLFGVGVRNEPATRKGDSKMDAKAEFQKMWKDVAASAREFAALGLSYSSKALEVAGARIKKAEETLKEKAEKIAPEKNGAQAPAAPGEQTEIK